RVPARPLLPPGRRRARGGTRPPPAGLPARHANAPAHGVPRATRRPRPLDQRGGRRRHELRELGLDRQALNPGDEPWARFLHPYPNPAQAAADHPDPRCAPATRRLPPALAAEAAPAAAAPAAAVARAAAGDSARARTSRGPASSPASS